MNERIELNIIDFGAVPGRQDQEARQKNRRAFEDVLAAAFEQNAAVSFPEDPVYM